MNPNSFENNALPKVLIVGDTFTNAGGGGVTMTNLFKGWPKDKIAVATTHVALSGLESCLVYYRLGYKENKRLWPLNYIQPKYESGPITYSPDDYRPAVITCKGRRSKYNPIVKNAVLTLFQFFGFTFLENRFKVSESFLQWIEEYKPDIIYTQLATYELIKLMQAIKQKTNIPIAIHIMDDWPKTLNKPGVFYYYWKYKLDHELRKLFNKSDIFLSICDAMSKEYIARYKKPFTAFHNPIYIDRWLPSTKQSWVVNGSFRIVYTGRIGTAVTNAIIQMATVIGSLKAEGENIEFDIYTMDIVNPKLKAIRNIDGINFRDPVPHESYPALLPNYDMAVIPLDFDKDGLRFVQFSMPTKASEYMISGTPVLVYADCRTALSQYAIQEKWGYVVSENDSEALKNAIRKIMKDEQLRERLGKRARNISINNENAETVVKNFRKVLSGCLKN